MTSIDTDPPPAAPEEELPPEPPLPEPTLNTITRRIAAAIHLHASLAEHVHAQLVKVNPKGFAPNFELINSRILARHSTQARLRRTVRDLKLFYVWIFLVLGIWTGVMMFLFGYVTPFRMTLFLLLVLLLSYVFAFTLVWRHYSAARDSALLVFGMDEMPEDVQPPPKLPAIIEDYLEDTRKQNVVLFNGSLPFPGCGELIHHWTMTIDRLGEDGRSAAGQQPFTTDDVYKWLTAYIPASLDGATDLTQSVNDESLPEAAEPPTRLSWPETKTRFDDGDEARPAPRPKPMAPTMHTGWRLYVMGDFAEEIPGLFQRGVLQEADGDQWTRYRRPRPSVPESVFGRFIDNPQDWARPYVYITLMNGNGQLAVTMLLRVEVRASTIFYEANIFALRPLSGAFGDIWSLPMTTFSSRAGMFATVAPRCFPLMLRSIKPTFNLAMKPRRDREAARKRLVELQQSRAFEFGATSSLREDVARGNLSAHFFWMDEERWFQGLNRRALDMMRQFLVEHRAPVADFDRQYEMMMQVGIERARELYKLSPPSA
jgi:hypothetical protein